MTKAERQHLDRVASLGCIACYMDGNPGTPAEIHHLTGGGMGKKTASATAVGLCPPHHRGTMHPAVPSIHLDKRAFLDKYGSEWRLLEQVQKLIGTTA